MGLDLVPTGKNPPDELNVIIEIATKMPVTMVPISRPPSACAPRVRPTTTGTATGSSEGTIISLIAALVSMSTAL